MIALLTDFGDDIYVGQLKAPILAVHRVIYLDHYGNAVTGVRAQGVDRRASLVVGRCRLASARTFADAPPRIAFW